MRIHIGKKLWYDLDKDSVLSLISEEKTDDALHENLAPFFTQNGLRQKLRNILTSSKFL